MYFKQQRFLVFGLSKSGKAAAEFLCERGAKVYLYDELQTERIQRTAERLVSLGAKPVSADEVPSMSKLCDGLVLSPGVPIDHPLALEFRRGGKGVIGETELAARYLHCPTIAVTGTNGKTTTVSLLTETLTRGGLSAKACGNIGTPMLDMRAMGEDEIAVAEISSFQLETLQSLRPHIAIVLNVTEDHLNRHYSMENYVFLKGRLLKNLTQTEYAILNYDDPVVRGFADRTKGQILYFSTQERVKGGYLEDGWLCFGKEKLISATELSMGGLHNIQNALAVIVAAKIMGVKNEDIVAALKEFKGIKHRIEKVGERDGVLFINDSKGTNVDAAIKAVSCMERETVLLLGGKDKGYDYNRLFAVLPQSKIVHAVLYGENRYALLKSAQEQNYDSLTLCDGFEFAVRVAKMRAKAGQAILLSPASASFDEFSSYEERGDKFIEIFESFTQKYAKVDLPTADEENE